MVNICPAPYGAKLASHDHAIIGRLSAIRAHMNPPAKGTALRCADRTHAAGPCNFGDEVQFHHEGVAGSSESANEMAEVTIPRGRDDRKQRRR
jgi:hypothetical protein